MQVAFTPVTAAEVRLLATFMQDYADLIETATPATPAPEAKTEAPKRERKAKTVEPEQPKTAEPEQSKAAEPEQSKAAEPKQSKAAEPKQPKDAKSVTHDDLRARFAELDAEGKRPAAVSVVKDQGFSSIKDIPADKCADIMEGWASL